MSGQADWKQQAKHALFTLLGKDPEGVVVTFASGRAADVDRMEAEIRRLVPGRRHIRIGGGEFLKIREELAPYRIAQACVMFDRDPAHDALRAAAFALAPTKILGFRPDGERYHLRPDLATWLFLRGDREIFHRPWLPTIVPATVERVPGHGYRPGYPRVSVVTPYLPWPLAHGGAVRVFHLLRETAPEFDVSLYSFDEGTGVGEPLRDLCAEIVVSRRPQYRKPRWWGVVPPEVAEFDSRPLRTAIDRTGLVQVEYTHMASYAGDILVEHDVTFDLAQQVGDPWNLFRWRWYEEMAVRRYRRVVVMSDKDAGLLTGARTVVIPNGVDLDRFMPSPEPTDCRLLFVASFAHFPNVVACRWFLEHVWPRLSGVTLEVVAGRDPERYWQQFTGETAIPQAPGITLHAFVPDVERLYRQCQIVVVPTQVSAGTNLKVLEAMAAGRPIVSTPSGCAGLDLRPGVEILVAESGEEFAAAIGELRDDAGKRTALATRARQKAEDRFGWKSIGRLQADLWHGLLAERAGPPS